MTQAKQTRINKYLSEAGYCSRRGADKLIESRRVTVNGEIETRRRKKMVGGDVIEFHGETLQLQLV